MKDLLKKLGTAIVAGDDDQPKRSYAITEEMRMEYQRDRVDRAIYELIRMITMGEVEWNIEVIGDIRDMVIDDLKTRGFDTDRVYPSYQDEPGTDDEIPEEGEVVRY